MKLVTLFANRKNTQPMKLHIKSPRLQFAPAVLAAASLLASIPAAQAALIAYEGFDIPDGSLEGQRGSGGGTTTWQNSTWDNTDNVWSASSSRSLTYDSLNTTTGGGFSTGDGNQQAFRSFGLQASTGTYWMGYIFNRVSGSGSSSLGISLFNGSNQENSFVGQAGNVNYGFLAFFGDFTSTTPVVSGEATYLLARYVMDGNTLNPNSVAHYWVNPDISAEPSTVDAANGSGGTNFRAFAFDSMRLGSFGSQGTFDEIRLGTTFGDVAPVPEPTSALLIGSGLMMALGRRRRSAVAR